MSEASWPAADAIIGNPPFLDGKRKRTELGDAYVDDLFAVYDGKVAREVDLCCYFLEQARDEIASGRAERAGLLATNSIRGGPNRDVLKRLKQSGGIFLAWSDEPWILDGAAVRISIIGFDDGSEQVHCLDGYEVPTIAPDLTAHVDRTVAKRLTENAGLAFMGITPGGPFDISDDLALHMLAAPGNPNGRSHADVIRPYYNGIDVTRRPQGRWIIDFGTSMPMDETVLYEQPFEYLSEHVKPQRARSRTTREEWWIHERPRVEMRRALTRLSRYLATSMVAKHRFFVWLDIEILPANLLIVFARMTISSVSSIPALILSGPGGWGHPWKTGRAIRQRPASRRSRCRSRRSRSPGVIPSCTRSRTLLAPSMTCAIGGSIRRTPTRRR